MLRFALIAVLVAACAAEVPTCGRNEVFNPCGSACPRTCSLPNGAQMCTKQCVVGCECAPGFVRDEATGQCVKLEECSSQSKCGENESFYSCGTACPPTCSNPNPRICTLQCVAECQCKPGFVRDDVTKKCVKKEECTVQECQNNAIFKSCGTMCPRKCSQRGPVPCPLICVTGCECAEGHLKEDATGECVREEECQQEECEGRTERYDRCSKACEKTCDNPDSLVCPMICMGGCVCQDGLFRHANGKCVKREECPAKQPEACTNPNEEFKECGPLGTPTCTAPVPFFSLRCRRGCHCKKNTYRNDKGLCVTSEECGAEKKCLRKQLEATDGAHRMGAFTPSCKADGSFEERQCHGSTGFCWCVDVNGVEVDGTRKGPGSELVECEKH